jgi:hypothetical protein
MAWCSLEFIAALIGWNFCAARETQLCWRLLSRFRVRSRKRKLRNPQARFPRNQ